MPPEDATKPRVATLPVVVMIMVFIAQGWLMWEMNRELVDAVKKSVIPIAGSIDLHVKESKDIHLRQDRQTDQLIQTLRMNTFLANCIDGHTLSKKVAGPCELLGSQITRYTGKDEE